MHKQVREEENSTIERLEKLIREATQQIRSVQETNRNASSTESPTKQYQDRFIINVGKQIKLVHDTEIAYLFTENKLVFMVTFTNQKYGVDNSLETFEKSLNPKLFFRINRQFIVNLKAISKMIPASKQRIEISLEPRTSYETITSFERTPQFKKWLLGQI